jgi:hypothetical protein
LTDLEKDVILQSLRKKSDIMIDFEWDITKAKTNLRKHRVAFSEATTVLRDRLSMKMKSKDEKADELRPEYNLATLLKGGVRGKYAKRYEQGTNLVLLSPDGARDFPNDEAVNEALRLVIQLKKIPGGVKRRAAGA